ncbi:CRISPR-associated endonuclease Cas4g/Cas1g [Thalassoglobus polymorphus]|uniref:CRISPR-associated endonuclease Cas1 n=1 Tax=Thalassoglobus polymorphus TaxID=2527994 RepID=A0A517QHN1_9PLAN|nr:CRISPR-associated endonuclease Cas1 [Thalassoglobus polymorphus]QDT31130.1 CRISPR-associated protein Cas4/endonuclease Cas1 fusion [Thalassoglobus polymorphus]
MIQGPDARASMSSSSSPTTSVSTLQTSDKIPDDALLPVRMLNEFTYCPRLGYLEWVQGEWAENLETRQGSFGHRVVDKADRKQVKPPAKVEPKQQANSPQPDEPDEQIHARSIMLSSDKEGLIAKLDLVELEGDVATPVDYKRGKVPDVPEGAYEPERVQLCAQGLVLRDNGYQCDEGVLYFIASKRRVVIPFDEELVTRTRQLVTDFRATADAGIIPPPLEDSPKCPRCSLVGICLPDETNLLQLEPLTDQDNSDPTRLPTRLPKSTDPPRRLLPAKNNALPLYISEQGAFIGKSAERLTIKLKKEQLASVRMLDVSQICLFGSVMLSAQAISELSRRGIPICHFSYGGWFHSITAGLIHKNIELRIQQYSAAQDDERSLKVAKQLIAGKIKNCRTLLRRHIHDKKSPVLTKLTDYHQRALRVTSKESLLGLEGMAAKEYFADFFQLFPNHPALAVNGRNRRPPRAPVNAVLSFLYSLLSKELTVVLQAVGFDPMLGVFHTPRYGRPSLALDLAEEFRPLLADSAALMVFNNGEVNADSFIQRAGAVAMTPAGRKSVIAAYERRMETEITHPIFGYKICYRRILEVQARLLARHLLGEIPEYPSFVTR